MAMASVGEMIKSAKSCKRMADAAKARGDLVAAEGLYRVSAECWDTVKRMALTKAAELDLAIAKHEGRAIALN